MVNKLILYYSYTKNTKKVAEKIQKATGADIMEIETAEPYSDSYDLVVDQGKEEVESGFKPTIKPLTVNLEDYNTIILGTPVWWYTYAPAIATFLSQYDLTGKKIIPFVTNGGWLGDTIEDIKFACKNSIVTNALNIKFDADRMILPESQLNKWIESL